jgi:NAD(P)-dependent dehydrogenase (short-subunit alcohol dehydrogenase family)
MGRMDGRVAIVTGGAGGIGAATSKLLASEGAAVIVADLLESTGKAVVEDIVAAGGRAVFQQLDVTDESSWTGVVESTEAEFGRLDVLVNNAGITDMRGLAETTAESWSRMIAIDQYGVMLGMKHSAPAIKASGGGSIVNLSSIAGLIATPGSSIAYSGAKGAVRLMTKFAAVELAKDGIRVNSVHPGRVDTEMVADQTPEKMEYMLVRTPLGRNAAPVEIAYGILFLASAESSYITGTELVIDGGFTAQ